MSLNAGLDTVTMLPVSTGVDICSMWTCGEFKIHEKQESSSEPLTN